MIVACAVLVLAAAVLAEQSQEEKPKRKVFGLGLSKTGTSTMVAALELLGYRTLHHDRAFSPFLTESFNFSGRYDDIDAVMDLPTSYYVDDLLRAYPDALYILTIRDEGDWYASYSAHNRDIVAMYGGTLPFRLVLLNRLVYGTEVDDQKTWMRQYRLHNRHVRAVVPAKQLLVVDVTVGDGFGSLCPFLGIKTGVCANDSTAFPIANTRGSRRLQVEKRAKRIGVQRTAAMIGAKTEYAYVSLLVSQYKGKVDQFVQAARSLQRHGSHMDIVALVLGRLDANETLIVKDCGAIIVYVESFGFDLPTWEPNRFEKHKAELQRTRLRVLELVAYKKVLYFKAGYDFLRNCDDLFLNDGKLTVRSSFDGPIDTNIFIIEPSWQAAMDVCDTSMTRAFNQDNGWLSYGQIPPWRESVLGESKTDWSFQSAPVDRGLLYYYYFCHQNDESNAGILLPDDAWSDRFSLIV